METLIDAIRFAVAGDATAEARSAGAQACRTILAALEAKPGAPLTTAPPATTTVQAIVGALRTMPVDQFLDLAIAKLSAALPAGTDVPSMPVVRFPIVPVGNLGGGHERG